MKKELLKFGTCLILGIMFFNILLPIRVSMGKPYNPNEFHEEEFALLEGKVQIVNHAVHTMDTYKDIDIYVPEEDWKNHNVVLSSEHNAYLVLNEGIEINITLKDSISKDYITEIWIGNSITGERYECIKERHLHVRNLSFSYDELLQYKERYGENACYTLIVTKNYLFAGKKELANIKIDLRQDDLQLSGMNANISPNYLSCQNGFISGSTLYMKPQTPIYVTTQHNGKGEYTVTGSNLTVTPVTGGAKIYSSGNSGEYGTLNFTSGGITRSLNVVVSNLSSHKLVSGTGIIEKNNTVTINDKKYNTCKEAGIPFNQKVNIKLKQQKVNASATVKACKIEVEDVTGFSSTTPKVTYNSDTYEISLTPKQEGVLKVVLMDYKNVAKIEYWHIFQSESGYIVKDEIPEEIDTDIDVNDTPEPIVGKNPVGSSSGSDNLPAPDIKFSNSIRKGNVYYIDVNISNCDGSKYAIVKRTGSSAVNPAKYGYNGIDKVGAVGMANPNSFQILMDVSEFENGEYDVVVYAKNGTVTNYSSIGPYVLGKEQQINQPIINSKGSTTEANGAVLNFNYTVDNCTELKYGFIKRDIDENGNAKESKPITSTYDTFNGTIVTSPKDVKIPLNVYKMGSGYYDIVIWAINKDKSVDNLFISGPVFINVEPQIDIIPKVESSISRTYSVSTKSIDKDTVKTHYYIKKKDSISDYTQPSIDILKNAPVLNNNARDIKISAETNGTGIYDLTVYSVDSYGKYKIQYVSNIIIANSPEIDLKIEQANEGTYVSNSLKDNKTVDITVVDKDKDDKITVKYFISDNKDIELTEENFTKNSAKTIMDKVNSGGTQKITVSATPGAVTNKYVYVMAIDKYGVKKYFRTGSIRVDGSELKLQYVFANKEQADNEGDLVGFKKGDDLQVIFHFNHTMKEQSPDLYMYIGDKTNKIVQNKVTYDNNRIIYHFDINENTPNGNIVGLELNYENGQTFEDTYNTKGAFKGTISKSIDSISNNYYIDTVGPTVKSIDICLTRGENSVSKGIAERKTTYIKDIESVVAVVKYSEDIKDEAAIVQFVKGNNVPITVRATKSENDIRSEDIYDLTEQIKLLKDYNCDGPIVFERFIFGEVTDLAGNPVDFSQYNYNKDIINYKIDNYSIGNFAVELDDSVYNISAKVGTYNLSNEADVKVSVGNKITYFDEFVKEESCYDNVGLSEIKFKVYYNENKVEIKDKDGNIINCTETKKDLNGDFGFIDIYNLTKEQLPISFKLNEEGTYKVEGSKKDLLGNEVVKSSVITVVNSVELVEEYSGFDLEDNEFYNIREITDKQKEFVITLKLENGLTKDDIMVYAKGKTEVDVKYRGRMELLGEVYEQFSFTATNGGKYDIYIANNEEQLLLQTSVEDYRVYTPCDTDFDGLVTALDVVNTLRYVAQYRTNESLKYTCDVDNNGVVDISDVILLSRLISEDTSIGITDTGHLYIK